MLREHGVLYPGAQRRDHFLGSMDLRQSDFLGHSYEATIGSWQRLVDEVDAYDGSAVISHETFARTPKAVIPEAVGAFDTDDVRVVVTARDLARQVPAVWQERIKNRGVVGYHEFLEGVFRSEQARRRTGGFWMPQDLLALTARWAKVVGPEKVTVVTVPKAGADRQDLWRRFAAATDLPDLEYDFSDGGSNPSLGVVESELMRRLNPAVAELSWPEYESRVKKKFAEKTLVTFSNSGRLKVPGEYHDDVRAIGEETVKALEASAYRIIGDLDDLRPELGEPDGASPDDVEDATLLDLSLGLLGTFVAAKPARSSRPPASRPRRLARKVRNRIRRLRDRG
jgi:hypothetical protein